MARHLLFGTTALSRRNRVIRFGGGGYAYTRTLSQLPAPSTLSGQTVRLVGPVSTIYATSDGTTWTNARTDVEITPYWLPLDAKLHFDVDNEHFYWNGAVRALSDLTVETTGGYSLADDFDFTGEATVVLETEAAALPANFANTAFSWTTGYPSGNRIEVIEAANPTYGDGLRIYVAPGNPTANFENISISSIIGEAGAVWRGTERTRYVFNVKSNTNNVFKCDNSQVATGAQGSGTLGTPTKIGFGNRVWAPAGVSDNGFTGGTLKRVTLYNATSSTPVMHIIGKTSQYHPVHLLGDSFLNLYDVMQQLRKQFTDAGVYISTSQDGVGGTSSTQQAVRYTETRTEWQDATLVWAEMGADGTLAEWQAAFATVRAAMKHDRFLVVEPAPNLDDGTTARDTFDAFVEGMRAACGGNVADGGNFVPTLEAAMALSDGGAQDLAKVAARRWPTSLTVSDADFHPNHLAGAPFLAGQIYDALVLKGWAE